jgi:hypothetical protein
MNSAPAMAALALPFVEPFSGPFAGTLVAARSAPGANFSARFIFARVMRTRF